MDERILQTGHDVKGEGQESCRVKPLLPFSPINQHAKMGLVFKNDDEDTDNHRRHIAGTLHGLAGHCHAAVHRHHHRERVTLFRPEISHCVQRRPHQMGQPHSHRTHDYPLRLFGRWERMRIRFRGRPAQRQLYTSRVGSRSLPLSLPPPSHHARSPYRHRRPPATLTDIIDPFPRTPLHTGPCESPSPSCRLRRSTLTVLIMKPAVAVYQPIA